MSIKLAVLKSGEQVIADVKELVSEEKVRGYLFTKPHKVVSTQPLLLTEEQQDDNSLEVTLSPWIILSADKEVVVPTDWVVTVVEPLESVVQMYQEKVNGRESN
tara:strand:+ start:220 stop:531 length:312 start_codon:yes stop_codon:yes gene_type:complete